jgi:hypothetical protein
MDPTGIQKKLLGRGQTPKRDAIPKKKSKLGHVLLTSSGRRSRKTPTGGPRRRWEDNITTDLKKEQDVVWIGFKWLRTGSSGGILKTR